MKIAVLMENTSKNPELVAEHGLSLWIETNSHTILFDSGQTDAFIENAEKMGLDLKKVDIMILSHGHYDHGGGLKRFLEMNSKAKIYMSQYAFLPCYHGEERYIGLDTGLKENGRLIETQDELKIDEGLCLYSCNQEKVTEPIESFGLTVKIQGKFQADDFRHEQYLLIQEGDKKVLISGCSHKGIINIVHWFKPDFLVGGFHFMKLDPEKEEDREKLLYASDVLLQYKTMYYTGHCTGLEQFKLMKEKMGDRLDDLSVGKVISI